MFKYWKNPSELVWTILLNQIIKIPVSFVPHKVKLDQPNTKYPLSCFVRIIYHQLYPLDVPEGGRIGINNKLIDPPQSH